MNRKLFVLVVVFLMFFCLSSQALAEDDGGSGESQGSDDSTSIDGNTTLTNDNETLDTFDNDSNTFTMLSSGSGGGSDGGTDGEGEDLGSTAVIDPETATIDLADDPELLTLKATTDVYEVFTGSKGNMEQIIIKEVTEDWQGDFVYSNYEGYWVSEPSFSVTGSGSGSNYKCTVIGTWESTAFFDHNESGTGTFYVDYSVFFDFYLKPKGLGEEKPLEKVRVDAETATIEVIDSRECSYTSEDIKGYRAAPGIVNFILKDLGYFGQPKFGQGEDPGYAGEKGTILSTVGKSMKEEDFGDRKDDYDLYIKNVYFTFFDMF